MKILYYICPIICSHQNVPSTGHLRRYRMHTVLVSRLAGKPHNPVKTYPFSRCVTNGSCGQVTSNYWITVTELRGGLLDTCYYSVAYSGVFLPFTKKSYLPP